jgi:hypothetical protein
MWQLKSSFHVYVPHQQKCTVKVQIVQAHTTIFLFVDTTAECQAIAMKYALELILSNSFERVLFKSDSQQVVNVLCNDFLYANELVILLSTSSSFPISNVNYNLTYVRRQVNRVTHNLARVSLFQSSPSVHRYYPYDCISSLY